VHHPATNRAQRLAQLVNAHAQQVGELLEELVTPRPELRAVRHPLSLDTAAERIPHLLGRDTVAKLLCNGAEEGVAPSLPRLRPVAAGTRIAERVGQLLLGDTELPGRVREPATLRRRTLRAGSHAVTQLLQRVLNAGLRDTERLRQPPGEFAAINGAPAR